MQVYFYERFYFQMNKMKLLSTYWVSKDAITKKFTYLKERNRGCIG